MPAYSTNLRLVQPITGEYPGSWGDQVNNGITALVDTAIAGAASITMTAANYTLSTVNGAADEARAMFLSLGGTPGGSYQVIVPAVSKLYFVSNSTGYAQTVKTSAGLGISVPNGVSIVLRCDGVNVVEAVSYFGAPTFGSITYTGTLTGGTGVVNLGSNQFYKDAVGNIGFGGVPSAARALHIQRQITGATIGSNVLAAGQAQSDVTSAYRGYQTSLSTASAAFTVGELAHYYATQGTIGASSAVTTQLGFVATNSLAGATNNIGFYSDVAAGATNWNFYANGTADNYFASKILIGTTNKIFNAALTNIYAPTAASSVSVYLSPTVKSSTTTLFAGVQNVCVTEAAAFTLGAYRHFEASQGTIGVGSVITDQIGYRVAPSLIGATNNYGFVGAIPSGTGRWNLYMSGTAANYFAGDMQFDSIVTASGTTGNRTINRNAGSVNFAAAATSLVVTNNRVTTSSIIVATVATNDATMTSVTAVAAAGSFTLHANAAATAETRVNFIVIN